MKSNKQAINQSNNFHRGFTLVEMLVVIGIIAVLIGVTSVSYSKMVKSADNTRAQELVSQAATALTAIYESDGTWPKLIREGNRDDEEGKGRLDKKIALILANKGYMSLSVKNGQLVGRDRYGVLTPWAAKELANNTSKDSTYFEGQILRFAVDLNGDGEITKEECGERTGEEVIRATVAVWCSSKDGKKQIQSWAKHQAGKVQ